LSALLMATAAASIIASVGVMRATCDTGRDQRDDLKEECGLRRTGDFLHISPQGNEAFAPSRRQN
jgi:hypothetical protein